MNRFVDTNIFLRYLTQDEPQKAQACFELFTKATEGSVTLITSDTIIAEVVYVLASRRLYNISRKEIYCRLIPIVAMEGLKLPNRSIILRAISIYAEHNIDFEDALVVAEMEESEMRELYSYDRGFDVFRQINRLEP